MLYSCAHMARVGVKGLLLLVIDITYPDIKAAGPDAFWDTSGVDDGTNDVEESHEDDPAESSVVEGMGQAISDDKMTSWNDSTQPQSHKQTFIQHSISDYSTVALVVPISYYRVTVRYQHGSRPIFSGCSLSLTFSSENY